MVDTLAARLKSRLRGQKKTTNEAREKSSFQMLLTKTNLWHRLALSKLQTQFLAPWQPLFSSKVTHVILKHKYLIRGHQSPH